MKPSDLLPRRCLRCGEPAPSGLLCRPCLARFGPVQPPSGPGRCLLCGQVLLAEAALCVDCSAEAWSFPALEGLFGYQEGAAELLRLYKAGGLTPLAAQWAQAAALRLDPPGPLVPVPPLAKNRRRRGWDPVDRLARELGRRTGLPVWRVLRRRPSASQKTLDRAGRRLNAAGAYALGRRLPRTLGGTATVWLLDDVVTTGATVEACARLLRRAGVGEVRVFCLGLH